MLIWGDMKEEPFSSQDWLVCENLISDRTCDSTNRCHNFLPLESSFKLCHGSFAAFVFIQDVSGSRAIQN